MAPRSRKLLLFLCGSVALCVGAEVVVRLARPAFEAAAHRARFKAALLEAQGPLAFAVAGTSRLNDGVNPEELSRALRAGRVEARGFNASVPSSSLGTQAFLADAAAGHGVQTLFLEASPRQLASVGDDSLAPAAPPLGFDERVLASSALVENRRVLMVENLPRLLALASPRRFDGSEFFRTRWLAQWWSDDGAAAAPVGAPVLRCPGVGGADDAHDEALGAWAAMSSGRAVIFVVPPLAQGRMGEECTEAWAHTWGALATRTGRPVFDFSCSAPPDRYFNDGFEHLGWEGRRAFSEALARAWLEWRQAPGCGGAK